MKLSIIFTVMNQHELARTAIGMAVNTLSPDSDAQVIVIDNGSDVPFLFDKSLLTHHLGVTFDVIRHEKSIGVYPTFWDALTVAKGDVLAYFHSDLVVCEDRWDRRVLEAFSGFSKPQLGLMGFIGSNEIDGSGGRGLGTTSNFQGGEYQDTDALGNRKEWRGSAARVHGKHNTGFSPAAVVDGCAMIFLRAALEQIPERREFPPHHFYDRLLSCEVRERGFSVGVLGIACDHISGQTVNQEPKYDEMAREWAEKHGLSKGGAHNWDTVLYLEAEHQWLKEYRDERHLVPCRV